jgi:hypothetical protein
MEDLKYPIGKYIEQSFSPRLLEERLLDIEVLPKALEYAITNMDAHQLEMPYRPGGWNSRQVVHHVADSHMNAYTRFKNAISADNPTIQPYDEVAWSNMSDVENIPINTSITLLYALHERWHYFLQHLKTEDWQRTVFHPEHKKEMTVWYLLGMYAWHGKHHVAHVNKLREREGI